MPPRNLAFVSTHHRNHSSYTLATVNDDDDCDDRSPLLTPTTPSYGTTNHPHTPSIPSSRRVILNATLKMAAIFVVSSLFLGLALLQAFSLPGSMYLSILGGAVWGVARALPLACTCVATGASLCYLISAALGPALLTLPKWKAVLDKWACKIQANKENVISFLIVLRIAPLPPHWVVNVVCPHVGIGLVPFWISTWLGVFGVSVIHTTIGGGLDEMTSADDFHLISWRNFFGLAAIVVGVMIPVGLRYWFRKEVNNVSEEGETEEGEHALQIVDDEEGGDTVLAVGPPPVVKKINGVNVLPASGDDDDYDDTDSDGDVILESGPPIPIKDDDHSDHNSGNNAIIIVGPSSRP
ncbi:hypothetical protein C0992_007332 [Termitomyces sp. T32_za158]|nr:hypothetical protein C0992_007332 [Termitomyces sp. T32_za158]